MSSNIIFLEITNTFLTLAVCTNQKPYTCTLHDNNYRNSRHPYISTLISLKSILILQKDMLRWLLNSV